MTQPKQAIIFDMDGTIVDNMHIHLETWLSFLSDHNIHLDKEGFEKQGHGNLTEIISRIFKLDKRDPEVQRIGQAKEKFYRDAYRGRIIEISGFIETLQRLKHQNISRALATMGDTPNIDLVVDALEIRDQFESIIGGHEVENGKPHPEIFLKTLDRLQVHPKNSLVIEDSISGIQAAINAGIRVIGITTSYNRERLMDAGCYTTISNYRDSDLLELMP